MQRVVVDALEDVKAQGIKVFNTVGLSDMFDRVVLASGTSNRQTRALASNVVRKVKDAGGTVVSVEGAENGDWVLVDLGDVVVHIMQPQVREYYGLEEMWGAKPVRVKLGGETAKPKPARPASAAASRTAGTRTARKAAGTTGARKTGTTARSRGAAAGKSRTTARSRTAKATGRR